MTMATQHKTGEASAAILAAGIGCFAMGVLTTLSEAVGAIGSALNWYSPVGALSGKSTLAILIWLVCWLLLHMAWRGRTMAEDRVFKLSYWLIGLGFLGTFPPFFGLL
jgi:hypothetical protein